MPILAQMKGFNCQPDYCTSEQGVNKPHKNPTDLVNQSHLQSMLGTVVLSIVTHDYISICIIQPWPGPRTTKTSWMASPLTVSTRPVVWPTFVATSAFTVAKWCRSVIMFWKSKWDATFISYEIGGKSPMTSTIFSKSRIMPAHKLQD